MNSLKGTRLVSYCIDIYSDSLIHNIDSLIFRFALDLGVPVVSMDQLLENVVDQAGKTEEFSHSFFLKVRDMVQAGDEDALLKERVHIKLLRLCS